MGASQPSLSVLARAGLVELAAARADLARLENELGLAAEDVLPLLARCADPDGALSGILRLGERAPRSLHAVLRTEGDIARVLRVVGASPGLADFFHRHPDELDGIVEPNSTLPSAATLRAALLDSVGARGGVAAVSGEGAWTALRVRYRRLLAQLVVVDLEQDDPVEGVDAVAQALADIAGAALDASLAVARADASGDGPGRFPADEVAACRLAIVGMGKAGARELNYVSDVDVIFVAEPDGETISPARAVDIGTRLATLTMRGVDDLALEPPLWQVDTALRPEGKDGALVRTLESHLAYYERWAKPWEFQALIKAGPLAGDRELAEAYVAGAAPKVWSIAGSENFVESVQRMRERVTENIPPDELDYQLKLGPGGIRDIEFTVQLLQLVHGQGDERVRQASTVEALAALAETGYIGRREAAEFTADYRELRLLEHRLQLRELQRTHLMPRDDGDLRVLARATGLATTAAGLRERWRALSLRVRGLHERLFYRPLLAAVAALPADDVGLSNEQAAARLAAIGFRDPRGALVHVAALSGGVSRRAAIQRTLLPVILQWFADGADPDYGLRSFRRLSEDLGTSPWFLRMLRDSAGAAHRLTTVLSGSRFAGELLGRIPESVAWLGETSELTPRRRSVLDAEARAILRRHGSADAAAAALRAQRRRETLRLAFAAILHSCTIGELARGLTDLDEVLLGGVLAAIRSGGADELEFAVIGMGRLGGGELGIGSDADVLYVYRGGDVEESGQAAAGRIVSELMRLTEDPHVPFQLDSDLRPEGKTGPLVRSLGSYRAYYERWSLGWEAQALLRARGVAGDSELIRDFEALADEVRYPRELSEHDEREIKRIKARVENERLPRGADRNRHLKLGRGSLSDVEWFVQLLQLRHAREIPELRTTSTLGALGAAVEHDLVTSQDAERLREAWLMASRLRSAMTLWLDKTVDVLPSDRAQLEAIARLLEYPPGSASRLAEDYLAVTRRARAVFERGFYGVEERHTPSAG